jgi:hypothetical protein
VQGPALDGIIYTKGRMSSSVAMDGATTTGLERLVVAAGSGSRRWRQVWRPVAGQFGDVVKRHLR